MEKSGTCVGEDLDIVYTGSTEEVVCRFLTENYYPVGKGFFVIDTLQFLVVGIYRHIRSVENTFKARVDVDSHRTARGVPGRGSYDIDGASDTHSLEFLYSNIDIRTFVESVTLQVSYTRTMRSI